jgi:hypothetical protein
MGAEDIWPEEVVDSPESPRSEPERKQGGHEGSEQGHGGVLKLPLCQLQRDIRVGEPLSQIFPRPLLLTIESKRRIKLIPRASPDREILGWNPVMHCRWIRTLRGAVLLYIGAEA